MPLSQCKYASDAEDGAPHRAICTYRPERPIARRRVAVWYCRQCLHYDGPPWGEPAEAETERIAQRRARVRMQAARAELAGRPLSVAELTRRLRAACPPCNAPNPE